MQSMSKLSVCGARGPQLASACSVQGYGSVMLCSADRYEQQ